MHFRFILNAALLALVPSVLAANTAKPRDYEEWMTHHQLVERLGCDYMLTFSSPDLSALDDTPKFTVDLAAPNEPYTAAHLLKQVRGDSSLAGPRAFWMNWAEGTPFLYKVQVRVLDERSSDHVVAKYLHNASEQRFDAVVAQIGVHFPVHMRTKLPFGQFGREQVGFQESDFLRFLDGYEDRHPVKSLIAWIYHPNANPPTPQEIGDLKTAAIMALNGKMSTDHITLHVIGPFQGTYIQYTLEIRLK